MRRKTIPVDFNTLCEEHTFSSEEYDLLLQRIREEVDYAPIDLVQAWKNQPGRARDALGRWL